MSRNLKTLGLALVAVLAMSAVVASAASAQNGRITADGVFKLDGTEEPEPAVNVNALTAFTLALKCPGSTYVGEAVGGSGFLSSGAETATITPTYVNCKTGSFPTTVTMNGCDYVLHLGATTGVADTYAVTADLVCPKEKFVDVEIYLSHEAHTKGELFCTIKINPVNGLAGATLKDETNGHLTLGGKVKNITAEKSGLCGSATTKEAELDLAVTVTGTDSSTPAKTTNLTITHN